MSEVQFSDNRAQAADVAKRYESIVPANERTGYGRINLIMDLTAADGVNGNRPLDWDRLLAADDFNFMHDVCGISRHINRETGELEGFFLPRFTKREAVAA